MTQHGDVAGRKHTPQRVPRSILAGVILLARILRKSPTAPLRFRVMHPSEGRYVRPPRQYEIPPFHEGMKHCVSTEKYLRPTLCCDPREPVVIAMANELGAYEKKDYDFAQAAFEFVKNNMFLEMLPLDSVDMALRRGTGICYHLISAFVALCRAAGIKARYKVFRMVLSEDQQSLVSDLDPLFMAMWEVMNLEAMGEVYVDGKWIDADVVASPLLQAANGMPITKFGETLLGTAYDVVPETMVYFESIPRRIQVEWQVFKWFAPALMERMNITMQTQYTLGRQAIEDAGGSEAYDQKARKRWVLFSPMPDLDYSKPIVFKE